MGDGARVSELFFYKKFKSKIKKKLFLGVGKGGRGTRVSGFFLQRIHLKKKFFFFMRGEG